MKNSDEAHYMELYELKNGVEESIAAQLKKIGIEADVADQTAHDIVKDINIFYPKCFDCGSWLIHRDFSYGKDTIRCSHCELEYNKVLPGVI